MNNHLKHTRHFLTLLAVTLLTACGSILPSASEVTSYQLTMQPIDAQSEAIATSLRINRPNASGLLTTPRLLVSPDGQTLNLYKGAQWHEATPILIRNHFLDSFISANIVQFVSSDDKPLLNAKYELDSDLRRYQVTQIEGQYYVDLQLIVRLIDSKQKRILASKRFTQQQTVTSMLSEQLVKDYAQAQQQLSLEVITWAKTQLNQQ